MTTKRCTAAERKVFGPTAQAPSQPGRTEPALGTLEQRLSIIVQRHGGSVGAVRMTAAERASYAAWLQSEGLAS